MVSAVLASALGGCRQSDPARAAAERFLDLHYVEINLERALEQTAGLARAKVEEEMRLLAGQDAPDAESKPTVNYRFLERQQDSTQADRRGFLYETTVTLDGGVQFKRRVLLTVREEAGGWRVANFQESD